MIQNFNFPLQVKAFSQSPKRSAHIDKSKAGIYTNKIKEGKQLTLESWVFLFTDIIRI
jgi:hypothetical protein